jgi:hypothetical protein
MPTLNEMLPGERDPATRMQMHYNVAEWLDARAETDSGRDPDAVALDRTAAHALRMRAGRETGEAALSAAVLDYRLQEQRIPVQAAMVQEREGQVRGQLDEIREFVATNYAPQLRWADQQETPVLNNTTVEPQHAAAYRGLVRAHGRDLRGQPDAMVNVAYEELSQVVTETARSTVQRHTPERSTQRSAEGGAATAATAAGLRAVGQPQAARGAAVDRQAAEQRQASPEQAAETLSNASAQPTADRKAQTGQRDPVQRAIDDPGKGK